MQRIIRMIVSIGMIIMGILLVGGGFTPSTAAVTTTANVSDCEPHWQRYSWTGGPRAEDNPPTELLADDNWKPNVTGDPHGIGQIGLYFWSNGNSGMGNWFYLVRVVPICDPPPPINL